MYTRLFAWRKNERLTQRQAAEKLGISFQAYRLIEAGRLKPSPHHWDALRSQFGREADRYIELHDLAAAPDAK